MHPYLIQQLAADHIKDMHAEAAGRGRAAHARRARRAARTRRARIGLRTRPDLAGATTPAAGAMARESTGRAALTGQREPASPRAA